MRQIIVNADTSSKTIRSLDQNARVTDIDVEGNNIVFNIFENGLKSIGYEGAEVKIKYERLADNKVFVNKGTIQDGHCIVLTPKGLFSKGGTVNVYFSIQKYDYVIGIVDKVVITSVHQPLGDEGIKEDDRFPILDGLIAEVQAIRDEVVNDLKKVEQGVKQVKGEADSIRTELSNTIIPLIDGNKVAINNNLSSINTIKTSQNDIAAKNTDLENKIAKNTNDISNNVPKIAKNTTDIAANKNKVDSVLPIKIDEVKTHAETNTTKITQNLAYISDNTNKINKNKNDIATNKTNLNTVINDNRIKHFTSPTQLNSAFPLTTEALINLLPDDSRIVVEITTANITDAPINGLLTIDKAVNGIDISLSGEGDTATSKQEWKGWFSGNTFHEWVHISNDYDSLESLGLSIPSTTEQICRALPVGARARIITEENHVHISDSPVKNGILILNKVTSDGLTIQFMGSNVPPKIKIYAGYFYNNTFNGYIEMTTSINSQIEFFTDLESINLNDEMFDGKTRQEIFTMIDANLPRHSELRFFIDGITPNLKSIVSPENLEGVLTVKSISNSTSQYLNVEFTSDTDQRIWVGTHSTTGSWIDWEQLGFKGNTGTDPADYQVIKGQVARNKTQIAENKKAIDNFKNSDGNHNMNTFSNLSQLKISDNDFHSTDYEINVLSSILNKVPDNSFCSFSLNSHTPNLINILSPNKTDGSLKIYKNNTTDKIFLYFTDNSGKEWAGVYNKIPLTWTGFVSSVPSGYQNLVNKVTGNTSKIGENKTKLDLIKMRIYASLNDLGVKIPTNTKHVLNAMINKSSLYASVTKNYVIDLPIDSGLISVTKYDNNKSSVLLFSENLNPNVVYLGNETVNSIEWKKILTIDDFNTLNQKIITNHNTSANNKELLYQTNIKITDNKSKIESLKAKDIDLDNKISSNGSKITNNKNSLAATNTRLSTVESDMVTVKNKVSTVSTKVDGFNSKIAKNTTDIATNKAAAAAALEAAHNAGSMGDNIQWKTYNELEDIGLSDSSFVGKTKAEASNIILQAMPNFSILSFLVDNRGSFTKVMKPDKYSIWNVTFKKYGVNDILWIEANDLNTSFHPSSYASYYYDSRRFIGWQTNVITSTEGRIKDILTIGYNDIDLSGKDVRTAIKYIADLMEVGQVVSLQSSANNNSNFYNIFNTYVNRSVTIELTSLSTIIMRISDNGSNQIGYRKFYSWDNEPYFKDIPYTKLVTGVDLDLKVDIKKQGHVLGFDQLGIIDSNFSGMSLQQALAFLEGKMQVGQTMSVELSGAANTFWGIFGSGRNQDVNVIKNDIKKFRFEYFDDITKENGFRKFKNWGTSNFKDSGYYKLVNAEELNQKVIGKAGTGVPSPSELPIGSLMVRW